MPDVLRYFVPLHVRELSRDPARADSFADKRETWVTILFADIEGCAKLCEDLAPRRMNAVIETYFSCFFDLVTRHGGLINEIAGDGFMAIFEGETEARGAAAAADAALAVTDQSARLNARYSRAHQPILVNIGIHAGRALVGITKFRMRSSQRWTYTASGPVANVAARLCARAQGGSILVGAPVARLLRSPHYAVRRVGVLRLKNVSRPVVAYRLLAPAPAARLRRAMGGCIATCSESPRRSPASGRR